ncbi:uncharacterized protein LOC123004926 [Tribolium madens]|uniref:uncharacterized protein LOC123004926 n=1 Tax=Tribolium madens TaxID=41895 RepID=UPI001CF721BF|nr:uncharacterized protein LOC123004926 [Tribolium madens]
MRYFVVLCCVLASVVGKEKKISLEDIERDNLKITGKVARAPPKIPVASPTDYGFVPTKTVADYARQQPKYVQYVPQTYSQPAQQYTPPSQQYATVPQQYYYQQQQPVNHQNPYQQYENVQYVTDNSIAQAQQQYYTPQYVYLQQYSAPSTAIQSVVDPKGGIQYVMYVPSYVPKAEQTQNYENVVYTNDQQAYVVPETQYVQTQQVTPAIKYAPQPQAEKTQQVFTKSEPKSLLDSYVPSILQVQYYKQQQSQANAIQQSLKDVSTVIGKSSYRPTQISHNSAESVINYNYQLPSIQQQHK